MSKRVSTSLCTFISVSVSKLSMFLYIYISVHVCNPVYTCMDDHTCSSFESVRLSVYIWESSCKQLHSFW